MTSKKKLSIASDHAGFDLKEFIKKNMPEIEWQDEGPYDSNRIDYPDYAEKVAQKVSTGAVEDGVLICGSGIGMCIAANKVAGVRAAVVESEQTARLSRQHNDANVLCIGARILTPDSAISIVKAWLESQFEGGRHSDRIRKIAELEKKPNGSQTQKHDESRKS